MTNETEIGKEGNVVIPLEVREDLGLEPGDTVMFVKREGEYVLTTRRSLARRLRGILARDDGRDMTQELLDERREEAAKKWS
jgi:AbrB family looped-hinge helix DNA binding protein